MHRTWWNWEKNSPPFPSQVRIADPNPNRTWIGSNWARTGPSQAVPYRTDLYWSSLGHFWWLGVLDYFLGLNHTGSSSVWFGTVLKTCLRYSLFVLYFFVFVFCFFFWFHSYHTIFLYNNQFKQKRIYWLIWYTNYFVTFCKCSTWIYWLIWKYLLLVTGLLEMFFF